ncbi:MAG: urea carboxylase [Verrucomicrobiales bacterium]|nr:urea carboxylase [Verrucomicrobiales bacterium]
MFTKVLVANRGEIACRILRTLHEIGVASVAVYSEADRDAPHVAMAGEAFSLGPAPVKDSYLNQERLLEILKETGAEAVHPGYGLLSESASFAERCENAGITFIGPTPEQLRVFGLKHEARDLAVKSDVPLLSGTGLLASLDEAVEKGREVGYPIMLKSSAGGGGIGIQICPEPGDLTDAFESVQRLSSANFGESGVFIEKYIARARHIEVQVFGDGQGQVVALGERDCSTQRRNQKVVEETPAPGISEEVRAALHKAAVDLTASVNYRSAGTVEFLYDVDTEAFYFLEVNTRLQVEHGVTEMIFGVDLVEWMVQCAAGEWELPVAGTLRPEGHAIEVRLYAEDPNKDFQPSPGTLTYVEWAEADRIDSWIESGTEVTGYYDPLLAKIMAKAATREEMILRLIDSLRESQVAGIETNLAYLLQVLAAPAFQKAELTTRWLDQFAYQPHSIDVIAGGTQTTVQDYPSRIGYWDVGVPPSGPMDPLAFRLANQLVGNPEEAAGLEMTLTGPTLQFNHDTTIALTGAPMGTTLDGEAVPFWEAVAVKRGQTLTIGQATSGGMRAYLAVAGGFDVPEYLGSRSTFILGKFGGHAGRALRTGDVVHFGSTTDTVTASNSGPVTDSRLESPPLYSKSWTVRVMYGPHGAPDFFTPTDIETFFETDWEIHYNSDRTGIRLTGPKPEWARSDGGEAGLHPSNIHDNAYGIGTVDFTGDMPVILGPDGPSLGGFVCPATIVHADLWKMGQLRAGDSLRFEMITLADARRLDDEQEERITNWNATVDRETPPFETIPVPDSATLLERGEGDERIVYRQSGDRYLLIEFGPLLLDLNLRLRAHVLHRALEAEALPAIIDLTPGIRSLQVHYNSRLLSQADLIDHIETILQGLPPLEEMEVPSRIVHLPLSWDDPSTRKAIEKYTQSVRPDAPWCPSNIEFIRRINGLDSIEDVKKIVYETNYLVLGLGDVYLGAPVATPLDPRHRLVTTKYNPARTWTPENAVGIGGAYLCVYGMEGPGGYQFVGRTIQQWNRYRITESFKEGKPWLLNFFDQIRWYPVTTEELTELRHDFIKGRFNPEIETTRLSIGEYNRFLEANAASIDSFKARQQTAFEEERERWAAAGLMETTEEPEESSPGGDAEAIPEGMKAIESFVAANVWKLLKEDGDTVEEGETVAILEAMKTEFQVNAPRAGTVWKVAVTEGSAVAPGEPLLYLEPA